MNKIIVMFIFVGLFSTDVFCQRSPAGCTTTDVKYTEKSYKEGSTSGGANVGVGRGEISGKGGTETTREYTVKEKVCNDRVAEPKERSVREPKERSRR